MLKKILFTFLLVTSITYSQESYYNGIDFNKTGLALKSDLATLITNTHTNTLSYSEVWTACQATDENPNNTSEVLLIYGYSTSGITARTRSKNLNGGNVGDWNREHTYAKSNGTPNLGTSGAGADAHHLRPSDVQFNGQRGSKKFAEGSGNAGDSNGGWYPGDEWKGDIARMMMYMYLRYPDQCVPGNNSQGSSASTPDSMVDLFLKWNAEDPPSAVEKQRNTFHENTNNSVAQGNRNPFIDNPRLATVIWGGQDAEDTWGIFSTSDTQAPTIPANVTVSNETSTSFQVNWTASTDNVGIENYEIYIDGNLKGSSTNTNFTVTGLTNSTTYSVEVLAKDAAGNESAKSASINGTTTDGSNSVNELFFSEYIEGSSNNKAIEIANFTGQTVSLANYSVKLASNGASFGTQTLTFTNQSIANGDVFVIGNSSLAICTSEVDINSNVTFFGGNDALGLFKNNVLIDVIGTQGNTEDFGKDVTLKRKPSISSPNTTFTLSEWDELPKDNCSDLGSHNISTTSLNNILLKSLKIYPNPIFENKLNIINPKFIKINSITLFTIIGKKVFSIENVKSTIRFTKIKSGIYLLNINSDIGTTVRKVIIK